MIRSATCADCNEPFDYQQTGPLRKYCNRCRSRHDSRIPTRPTPRPCKVCGAEMTKRADALTCSPRCRRRFGRARLRTIAPVVIGADSDEP